MHCDQSDMRGADATGMRGAAFTVFSCMNGLPVDSKIRFAGICANPRGADGDDNIGVIHRRGTKSVVLYNGRYCPPGGDAYVNPWAYKVYPEIGGPPQPGVLMNGLTDDCYKAAIVCITAADIRGALTFVNHMLQDYVSTAYNATLCLGGLRQFILKDIRLIEAHTSLFHYAVLRGHILVYKKFPEQIEAHTKLLSILHKRHQKRERERTITRQSVGVASFGSIGFKNPYGTMNLEKCTDFTALFAQEKTGELRNVTLNQFRIMQEVLNIAEDENQKDGVDYNENLQLFHVGTVTNGANGGQQLDLFVDP